MVNGWLLKCVLGIFTLFLSLLLSAEAEEMDIPLPGEESAIPMPGDDNTTQLPGISGSDTTGSGLNVRGYVENTFNYEQSKTHHREFLLNSTRSRLNLSGKPDKNFDFGIGIVGTLNSGAVEFDLASYMPDPNQHKIDLPSQKTTDVHGPLVVSREPLTIDELKNKTIAIPGTMTTAFLVLNLAIDKFNYTVLPFDFLLSLILPC